MSEPVSTAGSSVRFSRDGDQFHYLWAARRCLRLLSSRNKLTAISIEGVPTADRSPSDISDGDEVLDIVEYYGGETAETSARVRYLQTKHSTQQAGVPLPPSALEKTLSGFARKYQSLPSSTRQRVEFCVVSNRPTATGFVEAIRAHAVGKEAQASELEKLRQFTELADADLADLCRRLFFVRDDGYLDQRNHLAQETVVYLPGDDVDAPVRLKELVTRKALSENSTNPVIKKTDVLRALNVSEDRLFPAPSRLQQPSNSIARRQEADMVSAILGNRGNAIIHAAGGTGKSVLSQRIGLFLPPGSVHIVYDCFGNGDYRRPGSPRHRHKDALVQIANELAAKGLCDPLIPSANADNVAYLKAFSYRLSQSALTVAKHSPGAVVCVCVDAADNAQMAADEFGDGRAFARDLLRESEIDGVRVITLCRTERQALLDPPPTILSLELQSFDLEETGELLRRSHQGASDHDVAEFHRLTSGNPRVQATVLEQGSTLSEVLRSLGPLPATVHDQLGALLDRAVAKLRDAAGGQAARAEIDSICEALAVLRPLVPLQVLASIAGAPLPAVRSFAIDLGRPLMLVDDAVQFRDEPVETWFRTQFRPEQSKLRTFVTRLIPLAAGSSYVAATLPQLMLEADQLDDLVELALSQNGLPTDSPIERRDIELQRLQFALKASLRARNYEDAAKLAFRAGGETAGNTRQQKLIQSNTDLAAGFMEPGMLQELVSRRTFVGSWLGAHHAYEAGLLSYRSQFAGDARSRIRMAEEWLRNWSALDPEERQKERLDDSDIAELGMAHLNVHGVESAAEWLRGWRPREVSFRAGTLMARRLVDHCRWADLDRLAVAAGNDIYLVLAVAAELRSVCRSVPHEALARALRLLTDRRVVVKDDKDLHLRGDVVEAISSLSESVCLADWSDRNVVRRLLSRYLPSEPPRGLASRWIRGERPAMLRAYCLLAALDGRDIATAELADADLRKALETKPHAETQERREFLEVIGTLLPWHKLRADVVVNLRPPDAALEGLAAVKAALETTMASSYREDWLPSDEVATIWLDVLMLSRRAASLAALVGWSENLKRPLFTPTLAQLARRCSRVAECHSSAHAFVSKAASLTIQGREDAESQASTYIDLARSIVAIDRAEAASLFGRAVSVASKFGDEILDRWRSVLDLAERAATPTDRHPELAYGFSRCAEVAYKYVVRDKHFDWQDTVSALAGLCPASCLCILSRWRDRDFGSSSRLLPAAVSILLRRKLIGPGAAAALTTINGWWNRPALLRECFASSPNPAVAVAVGRIFLRYASLQRHRKSDWSELLQVAEQLELDVSQFNSPEEAAGPRTPHSTADSANSDLGSTTEAWSTIFDGLDLHTTEGLSRARARFRAQPPPWFPDRFFSEVCHRLEVGREAEAIRALQNLPELEPFDYRSFFESVPAAWIARESLRSGLAELARTVYRRFCTETMRNKHYERLPFDLVSKVTGVPQTDLFRVVLDALGGLNVSMDSSELFSVVGMVTPQLSTAEALSALQSCLAEFDAVLEPEDGDGPWRAELAPPADVAAALSGYLFAALGAPEPDVRWEMAHAVRGLCLCGETTVVDSLVELAETSNGTPFVDAKLHFYRLNAVQWLMIALARAASESASTVERYLPFFVRSALASNPHVLIRHFAASGALSLVAAGVAEMDDQTKQRLKAVNHSPFPPALPKERGRNTRNREATEHKRFIFDYDLGKYSLGSLARVFDASRNDFEAMVDDVIRQDWQLKFSGAWVEDERGRRGMLRQDQRMPTRSVPQSLDFYLSYHGMMVAAGRALASEPPRQNPDSAEDNLESWVNEHALSRRDGRWLSDVRDPEPTDLPVLPPGPEDKWPTSVVRGDFDRVVNTSDELLNVWGNWTVVDDRRKESVYVTSALVSPDRSEALLRALQTADDPHSYRIPPAGDESEIAEGPYELTGWIQKDELWSGGLDEHDPWAVGISFPPPKPAEKIRALLHLRSDPDCRSWQSAVSGATTGFAFCRSWSLQDEESYWEDEGEHGVRLQVSRSHLLRVLRELRKDLVLKVEIERRIRKYRHDRDGGYVHVLPYFMLFLLKADGDLRTLSSDN